MRRIFKIGITVLMVIALLSGIFVMLSCGAVTEPSEDGVLTVVATSFAGYDFARQILREAPAESVKLVLLGKPGQDMHSYEATAADITTLATADVVVCLGGSNEAWLDATLKSAMNENVCRVAMTEVVETMDKAATEGMDTGNHAGHDHTAGESCGLIGSDEHVWLSPKNAVSIVAAIGEAFGRVDVANAERYAAATATYTAELEALWRAYETMLDASVRTTVLIADRYPFAYLVRDLGLTCYAAFPGCSSETSASFETQTFLIEKAKEHELPYIFIIDGSDGKVAEVIAAESGAEVLTLDSCQVVTDRDKTYVGIMKENLENLKKALC